MNRYDAKLVLADDDPDIRALLSMQLERKGFSVFNAENGQAAIDMLAKDVDAVLIDLNMPIINGWELLDHLKKYNLQIPAIVITADDHLESAVDAMSRGAFYYITKPVKNLDDICALIHQAVLSGRQARKIRQIEKELRLARQHEISTAAQIQQNLLLGNPPAELDCFQLAHRAIPSQKVDGDFYDFFHSQGESLDLVIGDVMGKGVPAALLGAGIRNQISRGFYEHLGDDKPISPAILIEGVQTALLEQLSSLESFATLCYMRITPDLLHLVDCGHTRSILLHPHGHELISGANMPLGFPGNSPIEETAFPLQTGDMLLLYSDGLTEALNPQNEMFGEDRLLRFIADTSFTEPRPLLNAIEEYLMDFCAGMSLTDDFTCIAVKINASKTSPH